MSERNYYVICDSGCRFPAMTKEQILAAIDQAVSTGEIREVDTGFVTKIKEMNRNTGIKWWVGTMAEYNAIEEKEANCFYITTDDVSYADLCNDLKREIDDMMGFIESINGKIQHLTNCIEYRGLGEATDKGWGDIDNVTENGWYRFKEIVNIGGETFYFLYMRVDGYDDDHVSQELFGVTELNSDCCRLYRYKTAAHKDTVSDEWKYWSDWEWENPPMRENVEYRTADRWMGKPVYTKWETIPVAAGITTVYHEFTINDTENIEILRHYATRGGESLMPYNPVALSAEKKFEFTQHYAENGIAGVQYYRGAALVNNDYAVKVQIWYTKD